MREVPPAPCVNRRLGVASSLPTGRGLSSITITSSKVTPPSCWPLILEPRPAMMRGPLAKCSPDNPIVNQMGGESAPSLLILGSRPEGAGVQTTSQITGFGAILKKGSDVIMCGLYLGPLLHCPRPPASVVTHSMPRAQSYTAHFSRAADKTSKPFYNTWYAHAL